MFFLIAFTDEPSHDKDKFVLKAFHDGKHNIKYFLPVIAASNEKIEIKGTNQVLIHKNDAIVSIYSNSVLQAANAKHGRVFNHVPGLQAIVFETMDNDLNIHISI